MKAGSPVLHSDTLAVIQADGQILERILDLTEPRDREGLSPTAFARFETARTQTPWALGHQRRYALVHGSDLLASAERYDLTGVLDEQAVTICGIGSVFAHAALGSGNHHRRALVERLLDAARRDGMDVALLFAAAADRSYVPDGFDSIPAIEFELSVAESPRRGAPMTLVRDGDERDLPAMAAMGQVRAGRFRFRADRSVDLVKHAITRKRLLAGCATAGSRELRFVIAEEGITAAAYVVVSIVGRTWTIEECGDRDVSGARVGALLQALVARDPAEPRPVIRAWLPAGFVPPQVTICSSGPRAEVMMMRSLRSTIRWPPLATDDVVWWRSDIF